jgi:protein SCO1/2
MTPRNRKNRFLIIILLHLIVFFILFIFHLNQKYYGFVSTLQITPFNFEAHTGERFTEKELASNYSFIYFGFLHCDEVCPKGVSVLSRLAREIPDSDLRFIFVSIDPARDTLNSLNTFIQNKDSKFIKLKDSNLNNIEKLAGQFHIQFSKELFSKTSSAYKVNHSSVIILVHKSLKKIIQYPEGMEQLDRIHKDLENLKKE